MIQVHDLRHVDADVAGAWADHISKNLRRCDLDEIEAMASVEPAESLRVSLGLSTHAYAVLGDDGQPCAIFGAAPHALPGVGIVWMLGTDGILQNTFGIARATRRYFDELNDSYHVLWNYIDARNTVSLRWLRWGGFKLLQDVSFGPHPFHIFARTNFHV